MIKLFSTLVGLLLLVGASPPLQDVRFAQADLFLDPGTSALHAWQVELVDPSGRIKLVGVEGGADAAWSEAPYHDPAALQTGRIVLAAFTLDGGPRGRQRVARIHFAIEGAADAPFEARVQAAADDEGSIDDVRVEVVQ